MFFSVLTSLQFLLPSAFLCLYSSLSYPNLRIAPHGFLPIEIQHITLPFKYNPFPLSVSSTSSGLLTKQD